MPRAGFCPLPSCRVPRFAGAAAAGPAAMFPLLVVRDRRDVDGLALSVVRNAAGTTINVTPPTPSPRRIECSPVTCWTRAPTTRHLRPCVRAAGDIRRDDDAHCASMPATISSLALLASDATLVALQHDGQRLTRDRVELPPTKAKYLRVVVAARPACIDFRAVNGEFGERPVERRANGVRVSGTTVPDREGDFEYDLGGPFPIDRVASTSRRRTRSCLRVFLRETRQAEPWQPVATDRVLSARATSSGQAESSKVALPQSAGDVVSPPVAVDGGGRRYWLLRIDPRSGVAGTAAPPMRMGWRPQEIIFAHADPARSCSRSASTRQRPGRCRLQRSFPTTTSRASCPRISQRAQPAERVALGGETRLSKPPDVKRWALWAALVLGALVLGWMAWRLSRDMNAKAPTGDADADRRRSPSRATGRMRAVRVVARYLNGYNCRLAGELAEWSNAPDSKSGLGQPNGGSNPSLSAKRTHSFTRSAGSRDAPPKLLQVIVWLRVWRRLAKPRPASPIATSASVSGSGTGANGTILKLEKVPEIQVGKVLVEEA